MPALSEQDAKARLALLYDPSLPSSVLRRAAQELIPFSDDLSIDTLDPEALEMYLVGTRRVPVLSYEKIMAAITARELPQRWCSSAGVFCALARVFNDQTTQPDNLTLMEPHELAWAVIELETHMAEAYPEQDFDLQSAILPEVSQWVAACLLDEAMIVAPAELAFCQPYLDAANHDPKLAQAVRENLHKDTRSFADTPLGIQLQLHAKVRVYVTDRAQRLAVALETFEAP